MRLLWLCIILTDWVWVFAAVLGGVWALLAAQALLLVEINLGVRALKVGITRL